MAVPRSLLVSVLALTPIGCVLPDLSLEGRACPCSDGYVCDTATSTCVAPSASGGGGSGTGGVPATGGGETGGGGSGATGGGGSGEGGAGGVEPGVGLVVTFDANDNIEFEVAGRFRLGTRSSDQYMLSHWYDLASDPTTDLAENNIYSPHLYEAWAYNDGTDWLGAGNAVDWNFDVDDETPLRATLVTVLSMPGGLEIETQHTIYASGRIALYTTLRNTSAASIGLPATEFHHTTVNETLDWSVVNLSGSGALFERQDVGAPKTTLLTMNLDDGTELYSDFNENRYWDQGGMMLAPGDSIIKTGELVVFPGGMSLDGGLARIDDVRSPGAEAALGAELSGWDDEENAYDFDVTSQPVRVGVTSDIARAAPAFELHGWSSPSFEISLDGELLASSEQPIGSKVIAYYDADDEELDFVYLGQIAQGAPDSARLFDVVVP